MSEDIIKLKPKIGPFELDLNALWRRLIGNEKLDPYAIIAQRFLRLFAEHGIATTQIQYFLPQIALDRLDSPRALLAALDKEALDQTAELFKIRREWLDGVGDQIYDLHGYYKIPRRLFEDLNSLENQMDHFPVRALFTGRKLQRNDRFLHPLVLVLVEKIRDLGETEIFRYKICGDGWKWDHAHSRIQLKAMARIINLEYGFPVPMYCAKPEDLENIREGMCVPRAYLNGCPITNPSLEDYGLSKTESAVSKESDELSYVLNYMKDRGLEDMGHVPPEEARQKIKRC